MSSFRMKSSTRWLSNLEGGSLLDMNTGACYEVNKVGGLIAGAIRDGKTLEQIVLLLEEVFPIDRDTLEIDVQRFVSKLQIKGLIDPSE